MNYREKGWYQLALKDPKWYKKRDEILTRDNNACVKCGSTYKLSVHHKEYHNYNLPWEYDNNLLITLCDSCHKEEHLLTIFDVVSSLEDEINYDNLYSSLSFGDWYRIRADRKLKEEELWTHIDIEDDDELVTCSHFFEKDFYKQVAASIIGNICRDICKFRNVNYLKKPGRYPISVVEWVYDRKYIIVRNYQEFNTQNSSLTL